MNNVNYINKYYNYKAKYVYLKKLENNSNQQVRIL